MKRFPDANSPLLLSFPELQATALPPPSPQKRPTKRARVTIEGARALSVEEYHAEELAKTAEIVAKDARKQARDDSEESVKLALQERNLLQKYSERMILSTYSTMSRFLFPLRANNPEKITCAF